MRQLGTAHQVALKSLLTFLRGAAEGTLKVMDIAAIVLLRLSNDVMEGSKEPLENLFNAQQDTAFSTGKGSIGARGCRQLVET